MPGNAHVESCIVFHDLGILLQHIFSGRGKGRLIEFEMRVSEHDELGDDDRLGLDFGYHIGHHLGVG